jgi:hypothetical protein
VIVFFSYIRCIGFDLEPSSLESLVLLPNLDQKLKLKSLENKRMKEDFLLLKEKEFPVIFQHSSISKIKLNTEFVRNLKR